MTGLGHQVNGVNSLSALPQSWAITLDEKHGQRVVMVLTFEL